MGMQSPQNPVGGSGWQCWRKTNHCCRTRQKPDKVNFQRAQHVVQLCARDVRALPIRAELGRNYHEEDVRMSFLRRCVVLSTILVVGSSAVGDDTVESAKKPLESIFVHLIDEHQSPVSDADVGVFVMLSHCRFAVHHKSDRFLTLKGQFILLRSH